MDNKAFADMLMASVDKQIAAEFAQKPIKVLGEVILMLEAQPQDNIVKLDFTERSPADFNSYRGYYKDLAMEYGTRYVNGKPTKDPITVAEVLSRAQSCDGRTFTGYKGGDFPMSRKTLMWVAQYGMTGRMLIDIKDEGDGTTRIITQDDD